MKDHNYYVYILTNRYNTRLYIGMTNNISQRAYEHKHHLVKGHTDLYNLERLVYYEEYKYVNDAISREKQLKNWHKEWKWNLIKSQNPNLEDWYYHLM